MLTFLLRRLLSVPPLLLVISFLTFLLLQAAPGDYYSERESDPTTSYDVVMEMRRSGGKVVAVEGAQRAEKLGTFVRLGRTYTFDAGGRLLRDGAPAQPRNDQDALKRFAWPEDGGPTWTVTPEGRVYRWVGPVEGYFLWLSRVVQGDLGKSLRSNDSVLGVITERMGNTLRLTSVVLLLAWGVAVPLGVWSGVRPNSWVDHLCGGIAYMSLSVPSVFLALLAMLFAYHTGWFPVGDMQDTVRWDKMTGWEQFKDRIWHLVLPAAVIAATEIAGYMRRMRSQMVEAMAQDYVRTARAKGVSHRRVVFVHALRNAINPMVTLFGFSLAALLSGSFLVEVVTNWPGLAQVTVSAVFARDEPIVMASILMATLLLVTGNIVADVLLALVDPRIRLR